ncbi:MAG TPA: hypothetical protein VLC98_00505 [Phnomibacter sp.]|nr:hypothetical protein [Phnomibacter sp.]
MALKAVITTDIVNSTLLTNKAQQQLKAALEALLKPYAFEFYRGDSLQVYVEDAEQALLLLLQLRLLTQKLFQKDGLPVCDMRGSIGIGTVEFIDKKPGSSRGEAFTISGRGMDALGGKSDNRVSIISSNELVNTGFELLARFADYIIKRLTFKQAEVISEMLEGSTQNQAAVKLNKAEATISQHTKAAGWEQLSYLLAQYQVILKKI